MSSASPDPAAPLLSRRRAVLALAAAGAGAGAAAAIGACGGDDPKTASTATVSTTQMETDAAALNVLLDLEHTTAAGLETVERAVRGGDLALTRTLLSQTRTHAGALARAIESVGGTPVEARQTEDDGRPPPRTPRDALTFAADLEATAVAAYLDALGKIATDEVRLRAASILVVKAEQLAATRIRRRMPAVPTAFAAGEAPPDDE